MKEETFKQIIDALDEINKSIKSETKELFQEKPINILNYKDQFEFNVSNIGNYIIMTIGTGNTGFKYKFDGTNLFFEKEILQLQQEIIIDFSSVNGVSSLVSDIHRNCTPYNQKNK